MRRLERLDLSLSLSTKEEARRLERGGARLAQLRLTLAGLLPFGDGRQEPGPALCVVFEGWDASGKGGAIKRLAWPLDPRHVQYASYAAPTDDERRHHFLWRFARALPGRGQMTVYDRSWYGRVLVERVEDLATEEQWRRAYHEIDGFERALVDDGTILVKFWLHISDEEQLRRFEKRKRDPIKQFKLGDEDWRNRGRRREYEAAVEDMLEHTDTERGPWTLVEAESKRWARVKVMETTIAAIEAGLRRNGLVPPEPIDRDG